MVGIVDRSVRLEGESIQVDIYLHEMLTLQGWWHRVSENSNDFMVA